MIYLDFNRTTPIAPSVLEAMQPHWASHFLLPGQQHSQAKAVAEAVEHARDSLAMLVGCEAFELVFTSGGTEANNIGVLGICGAHTGGHLITSPLEHDSVCRPVERLAETGWSTETLQCDDCGAIDPQEVESLLTSETKLVCVQLSNATLGVTQPVREVAEVCRARGVHLHCDVTAAAGRLPVDLSHLGVDSAAISGHKFYGPKGSGALYVRRGVQLQPMFFGDGREMGLRPGAENIPAVVGIGAAAALASRCLDDAASNLEQLRERLVRALSVAMPEPPVLVCEDAGRAPGTVVLEMPVDARKIQSQARQLVFSVAGAGRPAEAMMRALQALGYDETRVRRVVHLSFGWTTSRDQVDRAAEMLADACE